MGREAGCVGSSHGGGGQGKLAVPAVDGDAKRGEQGGVHGQQGDGPTIGRTGMREAFEEVADAEEEAGFVVEESCEDEGKYGIEDACARDNQDDMATRLLVEGMELLQERYKDKYHGKADARVEYVADRHGLARSRQTEESDVLDA